MYVFSYVYSVDFGTVVNTNYAHDNSVTCVCWRKSILATGSLDCTVKVSSYYFHNVFYNLFSMSTYSADLMQGREYMQV